MRKNILFLLPFLLISCKNSGKGVLVGEDEFKEKVSQLEVVKHQRAHADYEKISNGSFLYYYSLDYIDGEHPDGITIEKGESYKGEASFDYIQSNEFIIDKGPYDGEQIINYFLCGHMKDLLSKERLCDIGFYIDPFKLECKFVNASIDEVFHILIEYSYIATYGFDNDGFVTHYYSKFYQKYTFDKGFPHDNFEDGWGESICDYRYRY